ncbi:MAG: hypothetical protein ACYDA8_00475 [Deferrisomatales bacterium]
MPVLPAEEAGAFGAPLVDPLSALAVGDMDGAGGRPGATLGTVAPELRPVTSPKAHAPAHLGFVRCSSGGRFATGGLDPLAQRLLTAIQGR